MNEVGKIITVNQILFETNDPEVVIKGAIQDGVMNYNSEVVLSHSQLNMLLNQLRKQNDSFTINDYLISEEMYNGEVLYSADISSVSSSSFNLNLISFDAQMKQIRA